ncbi:hypothetical protein TDB9533_02974 [Thalassocella blandensis]|nr:hypothetical protein TDB9533_02974 [Thalassocella blandensis]
MKLEALLQKTCLIGLQYFDAQGELLKHDQLAGTVENVDEKNGISIRLTASSHAPDTSMIASDQNQRIFVLPPVLKTWFNAPGGDYRDENKVLLISNPDFLVTWEVHQTQKEKQGEHEWWEWVVPRHAPSVN